MGVNFKKAFLSLVAVLTTAGVSQNLRADDELQRLRVELSRLQSNRSQVSYDLSRAQSDLRSAEDQERRDRDEAERASRALDEFNRNYARAQDRVRDLRAAVDRERSQKQADIQRLTGAVQSTQQQIASTDSRVATLRNEVNQLSGQADPNKLNQLNSELSKNNSDIARMQSGIADYDKRIAEMDKQGCTSAECQIVRLNFVNMRENLKKQVADLQTKNGDLQRQISVLQTAIQAVEAKKRELAQAENQLNSLRSQLPQLQSQLSEAQNRPIRSEAELAQAEQALRAMEGQRADLERRARDSRAQADRSRDRSQQVARTVQDLTFRLRGVDADIDRVQRRIAELENGGGNVSGPRLAIYGRNASSQLIQNFAYGRFGTLMVEGSTLRQVGSGYAIAYVFADTFMRPMDNISAANLEQFAYSGGIVIVVGDPAQAGLSNVTQATSYGVRTPTFPLVGKGILSGLNVYGSSQLQTMTFGSYNAVLTDSYSNTVGITRSLGSSSSVSGQIITVGLLLNNQDLDILKQVERALCTNGLAQIKPAACY